MGVVSASARVSSFMALALCVSSCPKPSAAQLERPAPPREGVADARVVFVGGDVAITPAQGSVFPARVGIDLVVSDAIAPTMAAKIIVVLRNGHAVRLDDTGALAVKDILLLHAPATDRDVGEQLAALLDPGELVPVSDVRDRAAAWRQMVRAGESGGAESARQSAAAPPARTADAAGANVLAATEEALPPPALPPAALDERAQKAPPPPELKSNALDDPKRDDKRKQIEEAVSGLNNQGVFGGVGTLGSGGGTGGEARDGSGGIGARTPESDKDSVPGDKAQLAKEDASPSARKAAQPPPASPAAPLLARFGATLQSASPIALPAGLAPVATELGSCVASAVAVAAITSVELLLEVRGGNVVRVRLSGALPVPPCARSLVPPTLEVGDGWLVVTVPLRR